MVWGYTGANLASNTSELIMIMSNSTEKFIHMVHKSTHSARPRTFQSVTYPIGCCTLQSAEIGKTLAAIMKQYCKNDMWYNVTSLCCTPTGRKYKQEGPRHDSQGHP